MSDIQNNETIDADQAAAEADLLAEPNARSEFLDTLLDQVGTKFELGAKAEFDDAKPAAFDASELVEWASHRAGVAIPDGSWIQYQHLDDRGSTMSVDDALAREGALLFWFSRDPIGNPDRPEIAHVAVSLGDGRVIEATEGEHKIVRIAEHDGRFTHAGEIPGLIDVELGASQSLDMWRKADRIAGDQDQDRLHDSLEVEQHGTKPGSTDSDNDGVSDLAEVQLNFFEDTVDRSDLDADRDGLLDAAEIRLGTDPNNFDTDGDGMDDHLEIMTGLDPNSFDVSIYARSDEGQALGSYEDRAGAFGIAALREHINYLRLEADPSDPRVPDEIAENFHLYGREPGVEDEAVFDEWHRNYAEIQARLEGDESEIGVEPEIESEIGIEPVVGEEAGASEPTFADDTDFAALDAGLKSIETELLEPFDELIADPAAPVVTIQDEFPVLETFPADLEAFPPDLDM